MRGETEGGARERPDRAMRCVSSQRYSSSPLLPYLLPPTHYHSVSLSLPPEARTLAPAAWQPLVSLTQLLCCLSHSQHSPPPFPPQQHQDRCSNINKQSSSSFAAIPVHSPLLACLAFLKMPPPKCDRNTTAQPG